LGRWDEPGPIIGAGPTRHRQPTIAALADRDAAWRDKAGRAAGIGVDDVLLRADEVLERRAEGGPVGGAIDVPERLRGAVVIAKIGRCQRQHITGFDRAAGQYVG